MTVPSSLYRLTGEPAPPSPVLVVALDGWVDAGLAGGTAMASLLEAVETWPYAVFDSEELLDQRARRPKLKIADGINEGLEWPRVILSVGADRLGSGIAMLAGPEPDMRWQSFSDAVAELATALEVRLMVGFGGFPAAAPHTRPVKLAATSSSSQLAQKIGLSRGPSMSRRGFRQSSSLLARKRGSPPSDCGHACRTMSPRCRFLRRRSSCLTVSRACPAW